MVYNFRFGIKLSVVGRLRYCTSRTKSGPSLYNDKFYCCNNRFVCDITTVVLL